MALDWLIYYSINVPYAVVACHLIAAQPQKQNNFRHHINIYRISCPMII